MLKIFAVVNGDLLDTFPDTVSPTYTRIHFLLRELTTYPDIKILSVRFRQYPEKGYLNAVKNHFMKTFAAIKSAFIILTNRSWVFFAYPYSLYFIQNRVLFFLCTLLSIPIILDIHDTIDQSNAIGLGNHRFKRFFERYCLDKANTLILRISQNYKTLEDPEPKTWHFRKSTTISGRFSGSIFLGRNRTSADPGGIPDRSSMGSSTS